VATVTVCGKQPASYSRIVIAKNRISSQSRTDLSEWLATLGYHWAGAQNEDAFLARLYNLRELPTTDSRRSQFTTAAEDIWQHGVNNSDWDDHCVLLEATWRRSNDWLGRGSRQRRI
jgi:hypothetical protein